MYLNEINENCDTKNLCVTHHLTLYFMSTCIDWMKLKGETHLLTRYFMSISSDWTKLKVIFVQTFGLLVTYY